MVPHSLDEGLNQGIAKRDEKGILRIPEILDSCPVYTDDRKATSLK